MITIDLLGKNALITGGTRGIGRAISRRLAQAGANTSVVYQSDETAADVSLAEREAFGLGTHQNIQADIGDEASINGLRAHVAEAYADGLDFLVLNAGIGLRGTVADTDPARWRRMFEVNLYSAFHLTRGLLPQMRRGGSIVAIGSGAGHDTIPGLAFYGASKAALLVFVADLAQETGPHGIRANVVSPGHTDNAFQENAPSPAAEPAAANTRPSNALGRVGVPDDVAGAVVFLCSDLSGFVTGQSLRVNGAAL